MKLERVLREQGIHQYPQAITGTIRQFCQKLYDELLTSGYSLLQEDVENLALQDVEKMAGWSRLECQFVDSADLLSAVPFIDLTLDISLLADEWAIVEPVVRCHCDILQARRVEGTQSLGIQPFGISSSEANTNYTNAIEQMKKEAFCHEPFSLDLGV